MPGRHSRKTRKKKEEIKKKPEPLTAVAETELCDEVEDKDSCFMILSEEKSRPLADQLLNRRFFVSKSYKDKVVYKSDSFDDALTHCPYGYLIFDSEGVKVFPPPARRLSNRSFYSIKKNRNDEDNIGTYRELQEAINHCPNGYSVYDDEGYKVY